MDPPPRPRDPAGDVQLSSPLARTSSFAFRAEQTFDEILESGLKVQFSNYGTAAVVRPNRAAAHVDGDLSSRTFWYDGRTMAIVDERHLSYVQVATRGPMAPSAAQRAAATEVQSTQTTQGDRRTTQTTATGRRGETVTGTREVTRKDDKIKVESQAQASTGASREVSKEIELDEGRIESVERAWRESGACVVLLLVM